MSRIDPRTRDRESPHPPEGSAPHASRDAATTAPGVGLEEQAAQAECLAVAGKSLIAAKTTDDVFHAVGEFFRTVIPGAIVIVNEASADQKHLITRGVVGLEESILMRAVDLVGFEVVGKRSVITDAYRALFAQRSWVKVPGGFAELASNEVPRPLGKTLEKALGIHDAYTIGIADGDTIYGAVHVLTREPGATPPGRIIESLVFSCFLTLSGIDSTRRLLESEARHRMLFDNMSEGFALHEVLFDSDGTPIDSRYVLVNDAYARMTELRASDIIGRTVSEVAPGYGRATLERLARVAHTGEPDRLEYYSVELGAHYEIIAYSPTVNHIATVITDVTSRIRSEAEIRSHRLHLEELVESRTAELRQTNVELKQATSAKSAFLANMSHELRTPLNSIIGFSGILTQGLAGPLTAEQLKQIGMIGTSGRYLLSLIDDVLDLAKVESGRSVIKPEILEVDVVLQDVADAMQPLADEKGIELRVRSEAHGTTLISDCGKLRQILVNLVGNAVKFTGAGHVALIARSTSPGLISFIVEDTGVGISEHDMPLVFSPFTQVGGDDVAKPKGTGLGLALSQQLAAMLGGRITVTSEPDAGSIFTLVLPLSGVRRARTPAADAG